MRRPSILATILVLSLSLDLLAAGVRIKDIVSLENNFDIPLIGYGLVVGLNGTGDRSTGSRGAMFTVQSISNMLENFGISVPSDQLRTRNAAAVMVTSTTPLFARQGSRFDVVVSSLGDATSLEGGVLIMTPLLDPDGEYYGQAQGSISIGGFNIETQAGEKLRRNHALVGRVPGGAIVRTTTNLPSINLEQPIRLLLTEPDFVTANRIADAINLSVSETELVLTDKDAVVLAKALNAGVVEVAYPQKKISLDRAVSFVASIETLLVEPDVEARVVINERTGTVVAGGRVIIDEIMITHGNITIHTRQEPVFSDPQAFSETLVEQVTDTEIDEAEAKIAVIPRTTSVSDLAAALNDLGVRPRDIVAIFQAIKQAGALNARLIIM
ncbi:MAG: flagellar basal body P-ring protein FlgI [Candidatus Neomarinimicrobiota bacterium]